MSALPTPDLPGTHPAVNGQWVRANLKYLLDTVQDGHQVPIERAGRVIAVLTPPHEGTTPPVRAVPDTATDEAARLEAELASSQAENARLRVHLDALTRQRDRLDRQVVLAAARARKFAPSADYFTREIAAHLDDPRRVLGLMRQARDVLRTAPRPVITSAWSSRSGRIPHAEWERFFLVVARAETAARDLPAPGWARADTATAVPCEVFQPILPTRRIAPEQCDPTLLAHHIKVPAGEWAAPVHPATARSSRAARERTRG